MTFVDDDMPVIFRYIESIAEAEQALQGGNIDDSGGFFLCSGPHPDIVFVYGKKCEYFFPPMLCDLLSVNQNESIDLAVCDDLQRYNSFAESSGGAKDTCIEIFYRFVCFKLMLPQLTLKRSIDRFSVESSVINLSFSLTASRRPRGNSI